MTLTEGQAEVMWHICGILLAIDATDSLGRGGTLGRLNLLSLHQHTRCFSVTFKCVDISFLLPPGGAALRGPTVIS